MTDIRALHLDGLSRRIGSLRVRATFDVAPGECAALVAPSGFGKTTLLRLIAGLDQPDSGALRLGARDLAAIPPERREIGYVFQDAALFPALNVLQNVEFGLRVRGVGRVERETQARDWLQRVQLSDRAHASVSVLSGGEKQRVALARALIVKPRVLLLDEPFSSLDRQLREDLRATVKELLKLWPVPALLISHDEADIEGIAQVRIPGVRSNGQDGVEERLFIRTADTRTS